MDQSARAEGLAEDLLPLLVSSLNPQPLTLLASPDHRTVLEGPLPQTWL